MDSIPFTFTFSENSNYGQRCKGKTLLGIVNKLENKKFVDITPPKFELSLKVMGLNPGYLLKHFLLYLRLNEQPEIQTLNGLYRLSIPLETENRVCGCSVQSFVTSLISKMTFDFLNIYWLRQLNENILIFWKVTSFSHFQIWLLWSRVRKLRLKKMSAVLN